MDKARAFRPKTILLWQKVADDPEAQRIIELFPSADVQVIQQQVNPPLPNMSPSQALLAGKRTLMIGATSSFVSNFDGRLGSNVRCCPYYKLVPLSNGCPYYCTYIAIWRLSIANTPHSLKSTSITKPCSGKYEKPWPILMVRLASIWAKCSTVSHLTT
ncbi:MAG: hypothetical protein HQ580_12310 [Planctomycetes bacterium]|nr:hypothetical protein [Planctomycetota bacterium]